MQKRSLTIAGHRTSISLEPEFWAGLEELATEKNKSLPQIIAEIDHSRDTTNLSSALRVVVLRAYQAKARQ